jgi:diacylglycerol O-acyltransferase / wax synthase
VADARQRYEAMQTEMGALKASHESDTGEAINSLAAFTPPMLYALGLRSTSAALRRRPQRSVHTVTTNVPGPKKPLFAAGRQMIEYLPFVPLSQGVRIGVAILSYNGQVRFGVTVDYDTVPEVEWFCRRIEAAIAELAEVANVRGNRSQAASAAG